MPTKEETHSIDGLDVDGAQPTDSAPPPLDSRVVSVLDAVRSGRMTRGRAARMLDMPLGDFLKMAGKHGILAIDYDFADDS